MIIRLVARHETQTVFCGKVLLATDFKRFNQLEVDIAGIGIKTMALPIVTLLQPDLDKVIAGATYKKLWLINHLGWGHSLICERSDGSHRVWYGSEWYPCSGWILDPLLLLKPSE